MNEVATRSTAWPAAMTLCGRELVRFFRQRSRVVGAIGQPVLFWVLFGAGLGSTFRLDGAAVDGAGSSYRDFFFPGTLALILLFTAIFATISIIEDRREGFLQSVLVAPAPRWAMVLGKVLGGTLIAMLQGGLFLVLALTLELTIGVTTVLALVGFMFLVALALTALGFILAWRLDSTQGFHAIMSVLLMPMWLLSGAFFPSPTGNGWIELGMAWAMWANPLTYGVAGLRRILYAETPGAVLPAGLPSLWVSLAVTVVFATIMLWGAWWVSAQRTSGDLL